MSLRVAIAPFFSIASAYQLIIFLLEYSDGQHDGKTASLAFPLAFHMNLAPMLIYQPPDEAQPQAPLRESCPWSPLLIW